MKTTKRAKTKTTHAKSAGDKATTSVEADAIEAAREETIVGATT